MYYVDIEKVMEMFVATVNKHKNLMLQTGLDWDVIKYEHPHYEGKIEQVVPYVLINWK